MVKTEENPTLAIRLILQKMLSENMVDGVMVAARSPYSQLPMPTLFTNPEMLDAIEPLAPVAPFNAARQAVMLLRHEAGKRLALILRPCEIRALIELVKLKQCILENIVLIGIECLGRMENERYLQSVAQRSDFVTEFYRNPDLQGQVTPACKACTHFQPEGADLTLCVIGLEATVVIGLAAGTTTGSRVIEALGFSISEESKERNSRVERIREQRRQERNSLHQQTAEKIKNIENFQTYFANCLNCYSCRVACPVCYCKECVFVTDVFAHQPEVLLRRAVKKGRVKLPTDTSMFHMTRLAHVSHACVGCGHCSSVCPSNIPVADVFIKVAAETQQLYRYEPGRDVNEPIPLLVFEDNLKEEDH